RETGSRLAVRSLPHLLVLSIRRPRGDRPVFQHLRQEGAAGVRGHRRGGSGNIPRGGHGRSQEGVPQAGLSGSGGRDRERRSLTRVGFPVLERRWDTLLHPDYLLFTALVEIYGMIVMLGQDPYRS